MRLGSEDHVEGATASYYLVTRGGDGALGMHSRTGAAHVLSSGSSGACRSTTTSRDGGLAWAESDGESTASARLFWAGEDGCASELRFPAVADPTLRTRRCLFGGLLGLMDEAVVARIDSCRRLRGPGLRAVVRTSTGQHAHWAGVADPFRGGWVVDPHTHVVVLRDDAEVGPGVLRAFNARTDRPLWSERLLDTAGTFFADRMVFDPRGRRLLLYGEGRAVVVDARTGRPLGRVSYPPSVEEMTWEDSSHLLMVDNGQVEVGRMGSRLPAWLVRCDLNGSWERATEVGARHDGTSAAFVGPS